MPEIRHSVCALDCPDACSLLIDVEALHGSRLRGNPEHPVTRGFLCGKVAATSNANIPPTASSTLNAASAPKAKANSPASPAAPWAILIGASRLDRSSAGIAGLTEALGFRWATEPEQFRHSKLIIAWGANILSTSVHLWPFIVEARQMAPASTSLTPIAPRPRTLLTLLFPVPTRGTKKFP